MEKNDLPIWFAILIGLIFLGSAIYFDNYGTPTENFCKFKGFEFRSSELDRLNNFVMCCKLIPDEDGYKKECKYFRRK